MASEIKVDTISEKTSANGVTIDGVNIKDSALATAGSVPLSTIDIDGGTDIGAAIVDADLFIIDDGAGGTNRKTAASRLKTYIGGSDPASADGDTLGTASLE
jgi:phage tail sheath protein FI